MNLPHTMLMTGFTYTTTHLTIKPVGAVNYLRGYIYGLMELLIHVMRIIKVFYRPAILETAPLKKSGLIKKCRGTGNYIKRQKKLIYFPVIDATELMDSKRIFF